MPNGILFRFGFEPIVGSGLCKCGERMYATPPTVEQLRSVIEEYNNSNGIEEPFTPSDYGYDETPE